MTRSFQPPWLRSSILREGLLGSEKEVRRLRRPLAYAKGDSGDEKARKVRGRCQRSRKGLREVSDEPLSVVWDSLAFKAFQTVAKAPIVFAALVRNPSFSTRGERLFLDTKLSCSSGRSGGHAPHRQR